MAHKKKQSPIQLRMRDYVVILLFYDPELVAGVPSKRNLLLVELNFESPAIDLMAVKTSSLQSVALTI